MKTILHCTSVDNRNREPLATLSHGKSCFIYMFNTYHNFVIHLFSLNAKTDSRKQIRKFSEHSKDWKEKYIE